MEVGVGRVRPVAILLALALAWGLAAAPAHAGDQRTTHAKKGKRATKRARKAPRVRKAAPAPAAPAEPVVFGTGGWAWPSFSQLDQLSSQGLRTWRLTMSWDSVSHTQGSMDFSGFDQLMRRAAADHIEVLVTLTGCPQWACPQGGPPASGAALDGFQRFVAAAVSRYGHGGSAWLSGSDIPVTYWQVLNEVNGDDQWPSPDPAAYAALLQRTSATIRATDPQAKVVVGGLGEKMTIWLRDYLPALYRQPGFKDAFDVMAPEGYAVQPTDVPGILDETRWIMDWYGDGAKPMFVTEMSWATGGPDFPFTTSEDGQAANLQAAWQTLAACRARWNLQRAYWFSFSDHDAAGAADYWGFHNGLVRTDGSPKPAYDAFVKFLDPVAAAGAAGACPLPRF